MPSVSLFPELSATTQAAVRAAYGCLLAATLVQVLPNARRYFLSERFGGYAKSAPDVDAVQNPVVMPVLLLLWMGCAIALVFGWATPWAALLNVVFCRYFFIHMRWKGVLRGMGAPGFIAYWVGVAVCLLEITTALAPGVRSLALFVLQVDLSLIMISAGLYKLTAGYARNDGMELGLCNPMWGYWWRWYVRQSPGSPVFWIMNQLAWGTEVVAGVMMLVPATRELGAIGLLILSFAFICTQIRLGFLTEMVIATGLLFAAPGGFLDAPVAVLAGWLHLAVTPSGVALPVVESGLRGALWTYLLLTPLAHVGLYVNFYARRRFPAPLQWALERYTNLFGIIIWRVFSVDLVNFFIRIARRTPAGDVPVGELGRYPRFYHVGEMICITSLFTTLKYYPGNDAIFQERILRYARTVEHEPGETIVFEYVSVVKQPARFDWLPMGEFVADTAAGTVTERWFNEALSPRAAHANSPLHAGVVPGSYAPASR